MHQILPLLHRDTQIPEENLKIAIDLYDEVNGTLNKHRASETHYVLAYKLYKAGTQRCQQRFIGSKCRSKWTRSYS